MKKVIINGSIFATGRKDGIPRYATEIVKELDRINGILSFEVVTPVYLEFKLSNITITILKPEQYASSKLGAEIWKQITFVNYARKYPCIILDLGMMLPFRRNDICAIYDCQPEKFRGNYNTGVFSKFINIIRLHQRKNAARKSLAIITDSNDAKKDIVHFLHATPEKVHVVYCAWQHFDKIVLDNSIFEKYPFLLTNQYFFTLGSRFKHKNIEWIFSAAKQNPQYWFVITGYNNVASYSYELISTAPKNITFTGYLSDSEIKALMYRCKAFIHPSFSEGFGMPPLEALSTGCEIIVSNTSCLPEVYQQYAHYIDPYDYNNINMDSILQVPVYNRKELLNKYSWEESANTIYDLITSIQEEKIEK